MRFSAWVYLKKVIFHRMDEHRWDRKGAVATLFFESFPNREYHEHMTVLSVRAITALLNPAHSCQTLEDYDGSEINHCWIYWGLCYQEDRKEMHENKWIPVRIDHKYWSEPETEGFKAIIRVLAAMNNAEIEDRNHPLAK